MFYEFTMNLRGFFEQGGNVLFAIFFVTLAMWVLIAERIFFFTIEWPRLRTKIEREWNARADKGSWYAHRIREAWISRAQVAANRNIPLIKCFVALCPLLGILGTVTGMILVFEVITVTGTGDARGMASGIFQATLPTMAGLVAALSGVYFASKLERFARKRVDTVTDRLEIHHFFAKGRKRRKSSPTATPGPDFAGPDTGEGLADIKT